MTSTKTPSLWVAGGRAKGIKARRYQPPTPHTTITYGPTDGTASQALFRALFDHEPKIDVRTPAGVAAQKIIEGWR